MPYRQRRIAVLFILSLASLALLIFHGEQLLTAEKCSDTDAFRAIFDGHTLAGWHAVPKASARDWTVHKGTILGHGTADRLSYLVWKDSDLQNFELKFRYRLPGQGNTGVEIRSHPDPSGKRPLIGYHADLGHVGIGHNILGAWDFHFANRQEVPCPRGTRLVIGSRGEPHATNIPKPLTTEDIHRHEWNNVHIVACGNHFQFFINDKLASEFTDNARHGQLRHGAIALQIHDKDMRVEFKDIQLKRLGATHATDRKNQKK